MLALVLRHTPTATKGKRMGTGLFRIKPNAVVAAPPRCRCAKCGNALGYRWTEQTRPAAEGYCATCRWLLRDVRLQVFLNDSRPDASVTAALGLPQKWVDRQNAEPVPNDTLNVEDWPEIDPVPSQRGVDFALWGTWDGEPALFAIDPSILQN